MESVEFNEPKKKRPHLSSVSSRMARNSTKPSTNNKCADVGVLQFQNQQLFQQIDLQKQALHDLEVKIGELKYQQNSYDDMIIAVNELWSQLVDDLVFLGIQAGGGQNAFRSLEHLGNPQESPLSLVEDIFLSRLIQIDFIETNNHDAVINFVEEAITLRWSSTRGLLKLLEDAIDAQIERTYCITQGLEGSASEVAIFQISKIDDMMKEEANNFCEVIDALHVKHQDYAVAIENYISCHLQDQSEVKCLAGELDERVAELEESRRKLVNLKMQKDAAIGMQLPGADAVNGTLSTEKPSDKTMGLRELKDSIVEAKIVAANRLSELQEAQEDNLTLRGHLQDRQNELTDDKYVYSSRPYSLVNDQLQHWNIELERYKALTEYLQAERVHVMKWEKELNSKLESADTARLTADNSDSRIEELELQLQKCTIEKNDIEIEMEEAIQDTALSKEMGMMEAQLKRWKDAAHEAVSLREKAHSLRSLLSGRTSEVKSLASKCSEQDVEIKSLKTLIEKLQKEKVELQFFVHLHGQENHEKRGLVEIRESESKALAQAEVLKNALDEHSLELRVGAANEAEAAYEQRLSGVEAEIEDLRAKLEASERDILELTEAIKVKDADSEAYISEIETWGQAYEDMQMQNKHLLQQMTERDHCNIKLVSESVKTKQSQGILLSEKQALAKQLQQINASIETLKIKIAHSEDRMKDLLSEAIKSTQEEKHLAVTLESAKWELADAEKELKWLMSAGTSSEKEYDLIQKDMEAMQIELDTERSSKMKLEEELKELNNKIDELSSETGETAIQKLQNEISVCKNMMKCTVCSDRPKEVVIVKCYHLFCNPCIQRNLELRQRKCPACGTAFGQRDVRLVKI